ncbi:hypothetical protein BST61_g11553 [Cercospora zeina]
MHASSIPSKLVLAALAASQAANALPAPRPISNDDVVRLLLYGPGHGVEKRDAEAHWWDAVGQSIFAGAYDWGADIAGHLGLGNEKRNAFDFFGLDDDLKFNGGYDDKKKRNAFDFFGLDDDLKFNGGYDDKKKRNAFDFFGLDDDLKFNGGYDDKKKRNAFDFFGLNDNLKFNGGYDDKKKREILDFFGSRDGLQVQRRQDLARRDPSVWDSIYTAIDNIFL